MQYSYFKSFLDDSWDVYSTGGPFWSADKDYNNILVMLHEYGASCFHSDEDLMELVNEKTFNENRESLDCNYIEISNMHGYITLDEKYHSFFNKEQLDEIAELGARFAHAM